MVAPAIELIIFNPSTFQQIDYHHTGIITPAAFRTLVAQLTLTLAKEVVAFREQRQRNFFPQPDSLQRVERHSSAGMSN